MSAFIILRDTYMHVRPLEDSCVHRSRLMRRIAVVTVRAKTHDPLAGAYICQVPRKPQTSSHDISCQPQYGRGGGGVLNSNGVLFWVGLEGDHLGICWGSCGTCLNPKP